MITWLSLLPCFCFCFGLQGIILFGILLPNTEFAINGELSPVTVLAAPVNATVSLLDQLQQGLVFATAGQVCNARQHSTFQVSRALLSQLTTLVVTCKDIYGNNNASSTVPIAFSLSPVPPLVASCVTPAPQYLAGNP